MTSWAKLSLCWGLKLEFEVYIPVNEVEKILILFISNLSIMLQSHHGQFSYFFLILARPQPNLLRKQLLITKSVVLLPQKISGGGDYYLCDKCWQLSMHGLKGLWFFILNEYSIVWYRCGVFEVWSQTGLLALVSTLLYRNF